MNLLIEKNFYPGLALSLGLHVLAITLTLSVIQIKDVDTNSSRIINIELKDLSFSSKKTKTIPVNNITKNNLEKKNDSKKDKEIKKDLDIKKNKEIEIENTYKQKKEKYFQVEKNKDFKNIEDYKPTEEIKSKFSKEKEIKSLNNVSSENEKYIEDEANIDNYKKYLKLLIQKKATDNYPRISIRKREEGRVELLFSIDNFGHISNIKIGKKTNAPQRLIEASKKTLLLASPYEKDDILKKKNTFSIIIVYKLE